MASVQQLLQVGLGSKRWTVEVEGRVQDELSSCSSVAPLKMKVETRRSMRRRPRGEADGGPSLTSSILLRLLRFSPAERLPRLLKNRDIPSMISPPYFADIHEAKWPGRLAGGGLALTVWGRRAGDAGAGLRGGWCLRRGARRARGRRVRLSTRLSEKESSSFEKCGCGCRCGGNDRTPSWSRPGIRAPLRSACAFIVRAPAVDFLEPRCWPTTSQPVTPASPPPWPSASSAPVWAAPSGATRALASMLPDPPPAAMPPPRPPRTPLPI